LALRPLEDLRDGGQLKVALLAATLGNSSADLLLLDEPDNYLDLDSRKLLEQALIWVLRYFSIDLACLLISHDPVFIKTVDINE